MLERTNHPASPFLRLCIWRRKITPSGKMMHLHVFDFLFHQNELSSQPGLAVLHMEGAAFPFSWGETPTLSPHLQTGTSTLSLSEDTAASCFTERREARGRPPSRFPAGSPAPLARAGLGFCARRPLWRAVIPPAGVHAICSCPHTAPGWHYRRKWRQTTPFHQRPLTEDTAASVWAFTFHTLLLALETLSSAALWGGPCGEKHKLLVTSSDAAAPAPVKSSETDFRPPAELHPPKTSGARTTQLSSSQIPDLQKLPKTLNVYHISC